MRLVDDKTTSAGRPLKYLCLVYPPILAGSTRRDTCGDAQLHTTVLVDARDLNLAVQRLCTLPLGAGDSALIFRLAPIKTGQFNKEITMKYLCLVYSDEQKQHSLPDSPEDSECQAYAESVATAGRMLAAEALEPVQTATTVRMRGGRVTITDGPFAETKEQLAGFYLVDAHNLDEALEIAAGIPAARVGCVEVRPVRQLQV